MVNFGILNGYQKYDGSKRDKIITTNYKNQVKLPLVYNIHNFQDTQKHIMIRYLMF